MITILLIVVSIILVVLTVAGFIVLYNSNEAEPLTPEKAKEIREYYEKKAEEEKECVYNFMSEDNSDWSYSYEFDKVFMRGGDMQ